MPSNRARELHEIAADADPRSMLGYQRVIASLVDDIADATPRAIARTSVGPVDVARTLRFELLTAFGRGLEAAHLVSAAAAHEIAALEVPEPAPELFQAARAARRAGGPPVALHPEQPSRRAARRRARAAASVWARRAAAPAHRVGAGSLAPDVVVIGQQPGHLADAAPLIEELEELGLAARYIVPDERTARPAVDAGLEPIIASAGGWPYLRDLLHIAAASSSLITAMRRSDALVAALGSAERDLVLRTAASSLARRGSALAAMCHPLGALLSDSTRLAVAINPYDDVGRLALGIAYRRGIATAGVEHGSVHPHDPKWERLEVDLLCAWGTASSDALATCGVDPEVIDVTGAPRFDRIGTAPGEVPPELRARVPWVLVATSGAGISVSLSQHLWFIELLYAAAEHAPELRWLVRLHPKDDIRLYDRARARHPGADVVVIAPGHSASRAGIYDHLAGATALVTNVSAAALDAHRSGTPVIVAPPPGTAAADLPEFLSRGISDAVATPSALAAAARAPRVDPDAREAMLARHLGHPGTARRTTAEALAALARRPRAASRREQHGGR